jgi:natural product biosynthesis luciferase-like monooxygenase protein
MEFSLFALPTFYKETDGDVGAYFRRLIDFLVSAEELGYDGIWANEHHFHPYGGLVPSPAVLLAAVAARTKRVRLGTSVVVLPLHKPIEIAEQLAMVDLMSGGRLELGIGRGFVPFDYATAGVPMEEGQSRTHESLEVILKAWSGGPFSHHGKHFDYDDLEVWPPVQQRPHPPVWNACSGSQESFEWTGRMGYNLLTVSSLRPMEDLAAMVQHYRGAWAAAGHDPAGYRYATHFQIVVDEDRARARQAASEAIPRYGQLLGQSIALFKGPTNRGPRLDEGFSIERWVDEGRILCGTPDDVVATLKRARNELGVTGIDGAYYFGGIPFETAQRSLKLFAEEVIPQVRQWEATQEAAPRSGSPLPVGEAR